MRDVVSDHRQRSERLPVLAAWKLVTVFAATTLLMSQSIDSAPYDSPGAVAMETRIRAIYRSTDWKADPNKPAERAAYLSALLHSGRLTSEQERTVDVSWGWSSFERVIRKQQF